MITQSGELWLEFRFPLDLLGSRRHFGITYIDVDDPVSRRIEGQTLTVPKPGKQSFNLVVLRTPEVRNIVEGLGYSGAKILVIDDRKQIRAEVGKAQVEDAENTEIAPTLLTLASNAFEHVRPVVHLMATGERYRQKLESLDEQAAFGPDSRSDVNSWLH